MVTVSSFHHYLKLKLKQTLSETPDSSMPSRSCSCSWSCGYESKQAILKRPGCMCNVCVLCLNQASWRKDRNSRPSFAGVVVSQVSAWRIVMVAGSVAVAALAHIVVVAE